MIGCSLAYSSFFLTDECTIVADINKPNADNKMTRITLIITGRLTGVTIYWKRQIYAMGSSMNLKADSCMMR